MTLAMHAAPTPAGTGTTHDDDLPDGYVELEQADLLTDPVVCLRCGSLILRTGLSLSLHNKFHTRTDPLERPDGDGYLTVEGEEDIDLRAALADFLPADGETPLVVPEFDPYGKIADASD